MGTFYSSGVWRMAQELISVFVLIGLGSAKRLWIKEPAKGF
jgi:hypothetical protein